MTGEGARFLFVALAIALSMGLIAFALGRAGWQRLGLGLLAVPVVLFVWMVWHAETAGANGMGGLVAASLLVLMLLPALVGGAIGLALGAWRRRQRRADGTDR